MNCSAMKEWEDKVEKQGVFVTSEIGQTQRQWLPTTEPDVTTFA